MVIVCVRGGVCRFTMGSEAPSFDEITLHHRKLSPNEVFPPVHHIYLSRPALHCLTDVWTDQLLLLRADFKYDSQLSWLITADLLRRFLIRKIKTKAC